MPSNTFTFLHSILIAAVALVWFATWLTQRRAQRKSHCTIRRLLDDRRLLEARLVVIMNGRHEARGLARELSANSRRLAGKLEKLEAEHARLAVAYSNLEAGLRPQTSQAALLASQADADLDDWFSFPTIIGAPRENMATGDLLTMSSIGEGWSDYPRDISPGESVDRHRLAVGSVLLQAPRLSDPPIAARPPPPTVADPATVGGEQTAGFIQSTVCAQEFSAPSYQVREPEVEVADDEPDIVQLAQCLDSQEAEIRRLRHQVAQLVERERSLSSKYQESGAEQGLSMGIDLPSVTAEVVVDSGVASVDPSAAPPAPLTLASSPPSPLLLSMSPTPIRRTPRCEKSFGHEGETTAGDRDAMPPDSFFTGGPFSVSSATLGPAVQAGGQAIRTRREPWVAMESVVAMLGDGSDRGALASFADRGLADASDEPTPSETSGAIVAGVPDGTTSVAPRRYAEMPAEVDNLKRIRGIGPVLERMLNRLGIYQYRQIASWSADDIAWFDGELQEFRGRIQRDGWVASAAIEQ